MTDQDRPAITPRQRAIDAYEGARERAAGSLSEAPLLALAGGLAAGALIAALLPRTKAETRALKPAVRRVRKTAKAAVEAARDTGSDKLNELGLTREKGEETIRSLFQGVTDAAKASGQAAVDAVKNQR
jgi:hypothetical protein